MKFIPHDYQDYTIKKMISTPHMMAILDMGLGKTVCTLTAIDFLMNNRFEINRTLVIAPLRVASYTWSDEIKKWDHLNNLKIEKAVGSVAKRIDALHSDADIVTINRENVIWLIEHFQKLKKWPFDCIVVDESSSFKSSKSKRFKALKRVTGITKRVILLTGTPAPNSLMDLWPQMFLVDKGQRLGQTITSYRTKYFNPGRRNRVIVYDYVPKKGSEEEIYQKISDVTMSLKASDVSLPMPERVDNFIELEMDKKSRKLYDELEREYILTLDEDNITAGSAAVVVNKLLQMANGAVYSNDKNVIQIHDLKIEALREIMDDYPGKPIMVFYNFKHDLAKLKEAFKDEDPKTLDKEEDMKAWNAGEVRLLLAHPASMGHGLNLQSGGSIIVWYGLTWSLELYQQANARLYRQGQKDTVIINHLVVKNTEDENVIRAIKNKAVNQDELIKAVKAKIRKIKMTCNN